MGHQKTHIFFSPVLCISCMNLGKSLNPSLKLYISKMGINEIYTHPTFWFGRLRCQRLVLHLGTTGR